MTDNKAELYLTTAVDPMFNKDMDICPQHGRTGGISITVDSRELGKWCLVCLVEALDRIGVERVEAKSEVSDG